MWWLHWHYLRHLRELAQVRTDPIHANFLLALQEHHVKLNQLICQAVLPRHPRLLLLHDWHALHLRHPELRRLLNLLLLLLHLGVHLHDHIQLLLDLLCVGLAGAPTLSLISTIELILILHKVDLVQSWHHRRHLRGPAIESEIILAWRLLLLFNLKTLLRDLLWKRRRLHFGSLLRSYGFETHLGLVAQFRCLFLAHHLSVGLLLFLLRFFVLFRNDFLDPLYPSQVANPDSRFLLLGYHFRLPHIAPTHQYIQQLLIMHSDFDLLLCPAFPREGIIIFFLLLYHIHSVFVPHPD